MSPPPTVFDPGLQPERTVLAWRRTALSLVVASTLSARLMAPALGAEAVAVVSGAGLGLALVLVVAAARRRRGVEASLREHGDLSQAPGAATLAVTAATCFASGMAALVFVLGRTLT